MPFTREIRLITHAIVDSTSSRSVGQLPKISFLNARYFNKYYSVPAIRKRLLPYLMIQPSLPLHTEVLNRNMAVKKSDKEEKNNKQGPAKRPLVIILAWMLAKNKHLDKYTRMYSDRGFDVLTVTLSPLDMLFPKTGTQVIASNVLQYLNSHPEYDNILVHGFSVGAYLFGEMVVKLNDDPQFKDLLTKFSGLIFDSAVGFEGIPKGFPRAVAKNPVIIRMLEWYTNTHLKVMHEKATKHYLKASDDFHHKMPLKCPALLLVSHDDIVGNPAMNQKLANDWKAIGIKVSWKCWNHSGHCTHMLKYPDEYVSTVDTFLGQTGLGIRANL